MTSTTQRNGKLSTQVPNHWLRGLLDQPAARPHREAALAAAGLDIDALVTPGDTIPRGCESRVLGYLSSALNRPYSSAEFGIAQEPRNSSLLTYIMFNSDTLRDALHHVSRFVPVMRPRAYVEVREHPGFADLVLDKLEPGTLLDVQLIEFAIGAMLTALRAATGRARLSVHIGIASARNRGQSALSSIYDAPVELNAGATYLRFAEDALVLPIRNADADLLKHLTSYGEVLLSRVPERSLTMAGRIERHILHGMGAGRPTLADTAADFGISERTLSRRLVQEGTSFREVVSLAQLKLAHTFLSDPRLSLAEISHLCGFSDQSGFTQAYRRWTGRTPRVDRMYLISGEKPPTSPTGQISTKFDGNMT
ncbi:MAG: AraC family transcriptional regulator [Marinibacterium sp.]|nr:AraC family transcriptional regulator [Marinibacterium sp.]